MPNETIVKAEIKDIQRLAKRIGDSDQLSNLFTGTRRAGEAEVMVAQTVHASVTNHKKRGEAFSFRGDGVSKFSHGGLVDNGTAYGMLTSREYFMEEERGGKTVIFITQKLVDYLDAFFARTTAG